MHATAGRSDSGQLRAPGVRGWGALGVAVGALGFSSAVTQLVLLRELLSVVHGNELILGMLLGNWLLLTGVGAWLGRWLARASRFGNVSVRRVCALLVWVALAPLAQVSFVRVGWGWVFLRGEVPGVAGTALATLALLAPYCLVSGALLSLLCGVAPAKRGPDEAVGGVYVADSLGGLIGGAVFTFGLAGWLDHLAVLAVSATICLGAVGCLSWAGDRRGAAAATFGLAAMLLLATAIVEPDAITTARQHAPETVLFRAQSPYGRLVVTTQAGQQVFRENGVPFFSSENTEQVEETVHFAMTQRPGAEEVLLISGGVSGTAREVLKYPVRRVTYVELDPLLLEAGRRVLPGRLDDARIRVVNADGRRYVQRARERFDVVIIDVPDPATAQLNRYYTAEFLLEVKRVIEAEGVLVFGLGRYENRVGPELERMLATAGATVRTAFRHWLALPAGRVWFLASDGPLDSEAASRIERSAVETRWMKRSYLSALLSPDRVAAVQEAAGRPSRPNTDFRPVLYFAHWRHWLSQFTFGWGPVAGMALALAWVIGAVSRSAIAFAVGASGLAASAIQVAILLGMQTLYGAMYRGMGMLLTAFMGGLALGAWAARRLGRTGAQSSSRTALDTRRSTPGDRGRGWLRESARDETFVHMHESLARNADGSPMARVPVDGTARRGLAVAAVAVGLASLAVPALLWGLGRAQVGPVLGETALAVASFGLAAIVGFEFPLATRVAGGTAVATGGQLYFADLAGASAGAALMGALMVPVLGVAGASAAVAGLNGVAGVLLLLRGGKGGTACAH